MWLQELRLENFRAFSQISLPLSAGTNLLVGGNGAGKTSILESIYLLSHGRSFRTANRGSLMRQGTTNLAIFGRLIRKSAHEHRVGLVRQDSGSWEARINGETPSKLSELLRLCAVVCFEPGSHSLISGASEYRRSFLDWGLFHVEPDFLGHWRRYQKALKQRNILLKQAVPPSALLPWNKELAITAERVTRQRSSYLERFFPFLVKSANGFLEELGEPSLQLFQGWDSRASFEEILENTVQRDIARGFTGNGPHRADWSLSFPGISNRDYLSRGQQKLCALACALAQAEMLHECCGEWPIFCLDDLASELDLVHQERVVKVLNSYDEAQILITGTETPLALKTEKVQVHRFHVEPDRTSALL